MSAEVPEAASAEEQKVSVRRWLGGSEGARCGGILGRRACGSAARRSLPLVAAWRPHTRWSAPPAAGAPGGSDTQRFSLVPQCVT